MENRKKRYEGTDTIEGLKAFVEKRVKIQSEIDARRKADAEKDKARIAMHSLFELYCDEQQQADAYLEAPEEWTEYPDGTLTIDEVRQQGVELTAKCEETLALARRLWYVSVCGYDGLA